MSSIIQDSMLRLVPARRQHRPNGWISFNAVCCHHRGHKVDTRGRGGILINAPDTVAYSCFNCGFKTNWIQGQHLNFKFRRLLKWLGADENLIQKCVLAAMQLKNTASANTVVHQNSHTKFSPRALPSDIRPVHTEHPAWAYVRTRHIDLDQYEIFVSDMPEHCLNRRIIIPFTWQNHVIGYTARAWDPAVRSKYHSQHDTGYVYNVDRQLSTSKFVIVTEGPIDAMSIGAVSVLGNSCSEAQADVIDGLNRDIIVVPDSDRSGSSLIDSALEYGWSVSFPVWLETCKDINEAVIKYGCLFVMKTIIMSRVDTRLKIELMRRRLYNNT